MNDLCAGKENLAHKDKDNLVKYTFVSRICVTITSNSQATMPETICSTPVSAVLLWVLQLCRRLVTKSGMAQWAMVWYAGRGEGVAGGCILGRTRLPSLPLACCRYDGSEWLEDWESICCNDQQGLGV